MAIISDDGCLHALAECAECYPSRPIPMNSPTPNTCEKRGCLKCGLKESLYGTNKYCIGCQPKTCECGKEKCGHGRCENGETDFIEINNRVNPEFCHGGHQSGEKIPATPTVEQIAEEIMKEAYFDMTQHPSERPSIDSFMDEYVGHVQKRVAVALSSERMAGAENAAMAIIERISKKRTEYQLFGGNDEVNKGIVMGLDTAEAIAAAPFMKKGE